MKQRQNSKWNDISLEYYTDKNRENIADIKKIKIHKKWYG